MNINENNKNDRKFAEKLRGCNYKIPISQLRIALYKEMCYQNNATTSMPATQQWAVIGPTCFTQQPDMGCQHWLLPQQICNSATGKLDILSLYLPYIRDVIIVANKQLYQILLTTSGLSIQMHGVVSRTDAKSYDILIYIYM